MDFAHYTDDPVQLAVDLVNSYGWVSQTDTLTDLASVSSFVADHSGIWAPDVPSARTEDLAGVRNLRAALHAVFDAGHADAAAHDLNRILNQCGATPRLSTHGDGPHLHFKPDSTSLTNWLGVITAMGLATVIADHGFERLGVCNADDCRDVYVDGSRNRSRLHCSSTCRTRENVAAHRERQRSDD